MRHQRAANKELAERLARAEALLCSLPGGEILARPAATIMAGFTHQQPGEELELEPGLQESIAKRAAAGGEARPDTPDYEDLNQRFENLLHMLGPRDASPAEEADAEESDGWEEEGRVELSCSRPPDLLNFSRQPGLEEELECVAITREGLQLVGEEPLPDHIQQLVNRAMQDME